MPTLINFILFISLFYRDEMAEATTSKIYVHDVEPLKGSKKIRKRKCTVPVANVLDGPRVQWTAPMLHLGLSVSSSDFHPLDVCQ